MRGALPLQRNSGCYLRDSRPRSINDVAERVSHGGGLLVALTPIMGRSLWWFTTIVGFGCTSGGGSAPGGPPEVIDVPTLDGGTEPVWVYAAKPEGPGPHPVVIYGHGQGTGNFVNCTPDSAPADHDAQVGRRIANDLAARGYAAISVYYRNRGEGAPALGELRGRDHYILDARTFLAAAHVAHEQLDGDTRAALIGVSMGSFPATWATAPLPELADLQSGLELVTSIPTAMLGNHLGNTGRNQYLLTTSDAATRKGTVLMLAALAIGTNQTLAHDGSLTADDLAISARTRGVTAAGVELLRRSLLDPPDASLPGCAAHTSAPAQCTPDCFAQTFDSIATARGLSKDVILTDWVTQETLDAVEYWNPPMAVDPGVAASNPLLAGMRALSPAYALEGPLRTHRMLPLVSTGDRVVVDQLGDSNAPADLYLSRLRGTGVTIADPVPVVQNSSCGHDDYLDPSKPNCGWSIVMDELTSAFEQ